MLVDIIICTYNKSKFLKICLDALLPQLTPDLRQVVGVLIVDNNCRDNTIQVVQEIQKIYPFIKLIQEERQGASHAHNRGAIESAAEYICYLDDDDKPCEDYVRTLVQALENEQPDLAGGPVLPYYLIERPLWFRDEFLRIV